MDYWDKLCIMKRTGIFALHLIIRSLLLVVLKFVGGCLL